MEMPMEEKDDYSPLLFFIETPPYGLLLLAEDHFQTIRSDLWLLRTWHDNGKFEHKATTIEIAYSVWKKS